MSHTKINNYELHCTYKRTNIQCRHTGVELEAPPRKRPRGDLSVPVTDESLQSQFSVSGPRRARKALATEEVCVGNETASSVSSYQGRASRRRHAGTEQATGVSSDSGKPRSSCSDDQRWKVQQSAGKGLILRTSASRKSRSGLCLRN